MKCRNGTRVRLIKLGEDDTLEQRMEGRCGTVIGVAARTAGVDFYIVLMDHSLMIHDDEWDAIQIIEHCLEAE